MQHVLRLGRRILAIPVVLTPQAQRIADVHVDGEVASSDVTNTELWSEAVYRTSI